MSLGKGASRETKGKSNSRKVQGIPLGNASEKRKTVNCTPTAICDIRKSQTVDKTPMPIGKDIRDSQSENAWSVQTRWKAPGKAFINSRKLMSPATDFNEDENQFAVLTESREDAEVSQAMEKYRESQEDLIGEIVGRQNDTVNSSKVPKSTKRLVKSIWSCNNQEVESYDTQEEVAARNLHYERLNKEQNDCMNNLVQVESQIDEVDSVNLILPNSAINKGTSKHRVSNKSLSLLQSSYRLRSRSTSIEKVDNINYDCIGVCDNPLEQSQDSIIAACYAPENNVEYTSQTSSFDSVVSDIQLDSSISEIGSVDPHVTGIDDIITYDKEEEALLLNRIKQMDKELKRKNSPKKVKVLNSNKRVRQTVANAVTPNVTAGPIMNREQIRLDISKGLELPSMVLVDIPLPILSILMMYIPTLFQKLPSDVVASLAALYIKLLQSLYQCMCDKNEEGVSLAFRKITILPVAILAKRVNEENTLSARRKGMKARIVGLEKSEEYWKEIMFDDIELRDIHNASTNSKLQRDFINLDGNQVKAWDNIAKGLIRKASVNLKAIPLANETLDTVEQLQKLNPIPRGIDKSIFFQKLDAQKDKKLESFVPLTEITLSPEMLLGYLQKKQKGKAAGISQLRVEYMLQMATDKNHGQQFLDALLQVYNQMDISDMEVLQIPKQYHKIFALSKIGRDGEILTAVRPIALGEAFFETRCAIIMQANMHSIKEFFGLLQVGIGEKSGPEIINHLFRHNVSSGGFDTLFIIRPKKCI